MGDFSFSYIKLEKLKKDNKSLIGMDFNEIQSIILDIDENGFRADQIFNWLYVRNVQTVDEMANLPKSLREYLVDNYLLNPLKILSVTGESNSQTRKFLLECQDGKRIESVLMKENKRVTICISSQVGCALACEFCATGTMGIIRNLKVGEIVAQYLSLSKESKTPITNVVFMGMGEPFLNYDNVLKSADLLNDPSGINLGARHITISTAGIVPGINKFSKEKRRYKLAISLNGSTQEQRLKTMPIAKKYPLIELIGSALEYYYNTKKFLTFEYVLLSGINDSPEDARQLIKILNDFPCKLNVIPYNEIGGKFKRPNDDRINGFLDNFKNVPFTVTTRWSKGSDINAGCGQLVVK